MFKILVILLFVFNLSACNYNPQENDGFVFFKKGDPIPSHWLNITPPEKFSIRVFGQDCVLHNNQLFPIQEDDDSAFIILDDPIKENQMGASIECTSSCPVFMGMLLVKTTK